MDPIELSSKLIGYRSITPNSSGSIEYLKKLLVPETKNEQCFFELNVKIVKISKT